MAGTAGRDAKAAALRASRTLNPRPETVTDEAFAASEFFDARDMVQVKYEMVRSARVGGAPVSRAAAAFGMSRPAFYHARQALDAGGLAGLVPAKPGPKAGRKVTPEVVAFLVAAKAADPEAGAAKLARMVSGRFGVEVHRRTVERALAKASKRPRRP
jgi:transposase-like protein